MLRFLLTLLAPALVASGCSLVLDWSEEDLLCEKSTGACKDGYTCLGEQCIRDHSVGEGETCLMDIQCQQAFFCPPKLFTCRKSCDDFFVRSTCRANEYCRPVRASATASWQGACMPSDCAQAGDCLAPLAGDACVKVTDTTNACFFKCTNDLTGGTYSHTCPPSVTEPPTCHPMGVSGSQQLVCMITKDPGQLPPMDCDPVKNPCAVGNVCYETTCHKYCSGTCAGSTDGGTLCCTVSGANVAGTIISWPICLTTCPLY